MNARRRVSAEALRRYQGWYFGNQIFNTIIAGKDFFREAQILKKYPSFATSYSESEPGTDWENLPTRDQELPWSLVVYYIVFVACAMVFIPYGPFCIAMGFIFGVYWGFLIQMGAIFVSSATLFIIGRYLFKDYVSSLSRLSFLSLFALSSLSLLSLFSLSHITGDALDHWPLSLQGLCERPRGLSPTSGTALPHLHQCAGKRESERACVRVTR